MGYSEGASVFGVHSLEQFWLTWYRSEAGGHPAGRFNSFEDMVRAHGRSPTSCLLLATLFCDVFGMDAGVYVYFPRDRDEDHAWDHRWSRDIALHSTPIEHARTRCFCNSPVAESTSTICTGFLAPLDPECEPHLPVYTLAVQRALSQPGRPLLLFPQVSRVTQRQED